MKYFIGHTLHHEIERAEYCGDVRSSCARQQLRQNAQFTNEASESSSGTACRRAAVDVKTEFALRFVAEINLTGRHVMPGHSMNGESTPHAE